jgi:hypothetical protein
MIEKIVETTAGIMRMIHVTKRHMENKELRNKGEPNQFEVWLD